MGAFGDMAATATGGILMNTVGSGINYLFQKKMANLNYKLNEQAADNADARRRALYADFESPAATIRQLKEAGLSPSLYAAGQLGGSIGSTAGAQGAGASGASFTPGSATAVDISATKLNNALANKANAEANRTQVETDIAEIERSIKGIEKNLQQIDFNLVAGYMTNDDGSYTSLFDIADKAESYEQFIESARKAFKDWPDWQISASSERGQKTLRSIYQSAHQFRHDIATLNAEEVNADFAKSVTEALANNDYAKLNAHAAVQYLRSNVETEKLTETQKKAWNDLLDKMAQKSETHRDIAIVLGMILQFWLQNAKMSYNGGQTYQFTTNNNVKP